MHQRGLFLAKGGELVFEVENFVIGIHDYGRDCELLGQIWKAEHSLLNIFFPQPQLSRSVRSSSESSVDA